MVFIIIKQLVFSEGDGCFFKKTNTIFINTMLMWRVADFRFKESGGAYNKFGTRGELAKMPFLSQFLNFNPVFQGIQNREIKGNGWRYDRKKLFIRDQWENGWAENKYLGVFKTVQEGPVGIEKRRAIFS